MDRFACADVWRRLDSYLDAEVGFEARVEIERHLTACPACRDLVGREARWLGALRAAFRRIRVPPTLRTDVRLLVATERSVAGSGNFLGDDLH